MTGQETISFGPFTLSVSERRIEKSGDLVNVGGRALDLLILLVERAGEVVTKKEIFDRVWPKVVVDEVSLRVHISAIRKALSDNQDGQRYIATIAGRGYCFVAPIARSTANRGRSAAFVSNESQTLPPALSRMVGRSGIVKAIADRLLADRFITIVGPGGIGKTTVAVSVARSVIDEFDGAVHFFDLGPLTDSQLVPSAIASALKLVVQANDPTPALIALLRDRRMLLVLDSCEHVISSVARLAERIFAEAGRIYILATSREILRVEGERAYQLPPLECPPDEGNTAAQIMTFAAPQLFVDRVSATGNNLEVNDREAALIGEICRRLDGIALAIELAAGYVDAFGLPQTAALLESRFDILGQGKRTALPRHQTLRATLDWSYGLLTESEQLVLRRLSVFVGVFTLDAARSVASDDEVTGELVVSNLASLVAKSLVAADTTKFPSRYRLLDTTRAYTLQKLEESGEADLSARRHALYFQHFLSSRGLIDELQERTQTTGPYREYLGNVRAALEWAFVSSQDRAITVALTAVAARFLISLSLLTECAKWAERAIATNTQSNRDSAEELELQSALGLSLMFSRGNSPEAGVALARALTIAEQLQDFPNQLQLLGRLHIFHERIGEYYAALRFAQRSVAVAAELGDPIGIAEAHSAIGISRHLEGDQIKAMAHLDAALVNAPATEHIDTFHFGFDFRNRAKIARARAQWLSGYPDQAVGTAIETVDEARAFGHPITHCIALIWAVNVFTWCGSFTKANEYIERFIGEANRHSLGPYQAVGRGVKAELAIKSGNAAIGVDELQRALEAVHLNRYELMTSEFSAALAEGLLQNGKPSEALSTIDTALREVDKNGDLFMKPELLRVRGNILAAAPHNSRDEIKKVYAQAIRLAESQGATSFALRGATSLASFLSARGRLDEAQEALVPVYVRFGEGFDTGDLRAARRVLDQLVEL